jgi:hypothetical protein
MATDTKQYFFLSGLQPSLNNKTRNFGEKADFQNKMHHPLNPVQLNNAEDTTVALSNSHGYCVESYWRV